MDDEEKKKFGMGDESGIFSVTQGQVIHELDQERQEALDMLRVSEVFALSVLNKERNRVDHVSFVAHEGEIIPFLTWHAMKAVANLAVTLELTFGQTLAYLNEVDKSLHDNSEEEET